MTPINDPPRRPVFTELRETLWRLYREEMMRSGFLGRSLPMRLADRLSTFWLDHWQWLCGTAIAVLVAVWLKK